MNNKFKYNEKDISDVMNKIEELHSILPPDEYKRFITGIKKFLKLGIQDLENKIIELNKCIQLIDEKSKPKKS